MNNNCPKRDDMNHIKSEYNYFARRIDKELKCLASNPEIGIKAIRISQSLCKIIMNGPSDSPFEGGFFIFD